MSAERRKLQTALCQYKKGTCSDIKMLKEFSESLPEWKDARETELQRIKDIKDRADKTILSISHVMQSENKGKDLMKYVGSKMTQKSADSMREEFEKELAAVLKDTLRGLEKLDYFLNAVERLAVTSPYVFKEEKQVLHLPQEISPDTVQILTAARLVCPLLLQFKRDAKTFFCPKLQNVEVLEYQLDKYIQTTQKICDELEKSSFSEFCLQTNMETVVHLDVDLSKDDIQGMLHHINQLQKIRMDQHFRMVFLFERESPCCFISKFDERQHRMLQFINDLKKSAVELDRMKRGAKISRLAEKLVGMISGVFSIVGTALIPVTAGASIALTMTGVGLGITSGVHGAVTAATEVGVNRTYQKKASEAFQSFMEDVQSLQECLEEASGETGTNMEVSKTDVALGGVSVLHQVYGVGKQIADELVAQEPQAAVNIALKLIDPAITEVFFIGMKIIMICKDSISLTKGNEAEVSQLIRARAALWSSEMDSWEKIRKSLRQGLLTSKKNRDILEKKFEPEKKERKKEIR